MMANLLRVAALLLVVMAGGCEATKDMIDTITFQKDEAAVTPAAVEPARAEKTVRSISIAYTSSGGIAGRIVEQVAIHTPDFQPQRPLDLNYVVDAEAAEELHAILKRHGYFNWQSLRASGADQYTVSLQVIVDGEASSVVMYGPEENAMSGLLRDLRAVAKAHHRRKLATGGVCAHRGAKHAAPENTVAAFKAAAALGAAMIELDVQRTADGALVILHDATVDRTTNGKGKAAEMTLAAIRALDAGVKFDARFSGEPVPTLDEALRSIPRTIWVNVHLKGDAELGAETARVLQRHDRLDSAFLAATKEQAEAARAAVPGVLICNMSRQSETQKYVEETIAMKADFIQLYHRGAKATREQIQQLRAAGVKVNYCCTDDAAEMKRLWTEGVNFVLTDNVEIGRAARNAAPTPR